VATSLPGVPTGAVLLTSLFINDALLNDQNTFEKGHYRELLAAVGTNLMNPHFQEVHVLLEGGPGACARLPLLLLAAVGSRVAAASSPHLGKLNCTEEQGQPKYGDMFKFAHEHLQDRLVVLSNTDVVFDETLGHIDPAHFEKHRNTMFVLSVRSPNHTAASQELYRCALGRGCHEDIRCTLGTYDGWKFGGKSWDAYVFRAPLPPGLNFSRLDFFMNQNGAENVAAFELESAGMSVSNPCYWVHAFHWHCSAKMHHGEAFMSKSRQSEQKVTPCWNCGGALREGHVPFQELCKGGDLQQLTVARFAKLFRFPREVRLCCGRDRKCDQQELLRLWEKDGHEKALPMCRQPSDTSCIVLLK